MPGYQHANETTCIYLRVKSRAIFHTSLKNLNKITLWRFILIAWKAGLSPRLCFYCTSQSWQAGLALHHTFCCGVFTWLPSSSKHTHTHTHFGAVVSEDRTEGDSGSTKTTTTVRHWSAEPGSSPLKVASWKCLEIAIKKTSTYSDTVARPVPSESASRTDFLLVTNWVSLYEYTELF